MWGCGGAGRGCGRTKRDKAMRKCQLGGQHPQQVCSVAVTTVPVGASAQEGWL